MNTAIAKNNELLNGIATLIAAIQNNTAADTNENDANSGIDFSTNPCAEIAAKDRLQNKILDVPQQPEKNNITFSFFLDGARSSSRKYHIGQTEYLSLSQIAVSCCKAEGHPLTCVENEKKSFIVVSYEHPRGQQVSDDELKKKLTGMKNIYLLPQNIDEDKVQDELCKMETRIISSASEKYQGYLLKDGIIEGYFDKPEKEFYVVGVSKNFSNIYPTELTQHLSALKEGQRTIAVWQTMEGNSLYQRAVWFLRIRAPEDNNKFGNIVRCEVTRPNREHHIDSSIIDGISRAIINYAFPVPYGQDSRGRWRTHLYPIFLTETYCKTLLSSSPESNILIEKKL